MKSTLKKILDIGEVSKESKLPPSTLRYYEEKGLIRSTGRHGLRRLYSSRVLEQLEFIALARHGGFSLNEIAEMFADDGKFHIDRKLLLTKANELDKHIKKQMAIRDSLVHVANCSAPNHFECPKFKRLLHLAGNLKVTRK
jgi:DNA-binding transcriptional MerR regulator